MLPKNLYLNYQYCFISADLCHNFIAPRLVSSESDI